MILPIDFQNKIKKYFKQESENFLNLYENKPLKSIRINTLKIDTERFLKDFDFILKSTGFSKDSFFIDRECNCNENFLKIGYTPLYHSGAFYVQEISATTPVLALDINKGDKVLDLCAAPGGKSTQIASYLNNTGLIWANEVIKNRANILLSNIERMGIKNSVVSSCNPDILCKKLSGFFDKVLVDAPCSGEGMFRKNSESIKEWSEEHVLSCSERQKLILESAKHAVKENGILVYSTCTFSPEENEEVICDFLKRNDNFEIVDIKYKFGRPAFSDYKIKNEKIIMARRITPLDGGEGHFIAKLQKKSGSNSKIRPYKYKKEIHNINNVKNLFKNIYYLDLEKKIEKFGDKYLMLPDCLPDLSGLNVLRAGLLLSEEKKSRIEPCHAFFMAARPDELKNKINFSSDSDKIFKFLRGEELKTSMDFNGFVGITINNIIVTGFGKCSNGILKNRYPKGLRNKK